MNYENNGSVLTDASVHSLARQFKLVEIVGDGSMGRAIRGIWSDGYKTGVCDSKPEPATNPMRGKLLTIKPLESVSLGDGLRISNRANKAVLFRYQIEPQSDPLDSPQFKQLVAVYEICQGDVGESEALADLKKFIRERFTPK